ncbi:cysteine-rich CWC family protein [Ramlibacter alkalitolerans]
MNDAPAFAATLCPLCGQPNRCAMELERETGVKQPACWCTQLHFSAELLARVPAQAQRRACLCPACARSGAVA